MYDKKYPKKYWEFYLLFKLRKWKTQTS
jgi:hypothetical protein